MTDILQHTDLEHVTDTILTNVVRSGVKAISVQCKRTVDGMVITAAVLVNGTIIATESRPPATLTNSHMDQIKNDLFMTLLENNLLAEQKKEVVH